MRCTLLDRCRKNLVILDVHNRNINVLQLTELKKPAENPPVNAPWNLSWRLFADVPVEFILLSISGPATALWQPVYSAVVITNVISQGVKVVDLLCGSLPVSN